MAATAVDAAQNQADVAAAQLASAQENLAVLRTTVATVPLGVWCALAMSRWPHGARHGVQALWLLATIAGGALVFWMAAALARAPERAVLLRMLPGRRRRLSTDEV